MDKVVVVDVFEDASKWIHRIIEQEKVIGIDFEGVQIKRCIGTIALIQVVLEDGTILLMDNVALPSMVYMVRPILESNNIIKIIHGSRYDCKVLFTEHNIEMRNIFDIQAVDSFLWKLKNPGQKLLKTSPLNQVITTYSPECALNDMKDDIDYVANKAFWEGRPLTPMMISYACKDVTALHTIFKNILQFHCHDPPSPDLTLESLIDISRREIYAAIPVTQHSIHVTGTQTLNDRMERYFIFAIKKQGGKDVPVDQMKGHVGNIGRDAKNTIGSSMRSFIQFFQDRNHIFQLDDSNSRLNLKGEYL